MIPPLSFTELAYAAVTVGVGALFWLYRHIFKGWIDAGIRWLNKPALSALAAHIKQSENGTDAVSQRALDNLQEALNLETRQRMKEDERLEKARE